MPSSSSVRPPSPPGSAPPAPPSVTSAEADSGPPAPPPPPRRVPIYGDTRVEIHEHIFFAPGSSIVPKDASSLIASMVEVFAQWPTLNVEIQGHAASGECAPAACGALGLRRADAMRATLIARGVDPARLTSTSFGVDRPIADGSTFEGRAKNRRVDFLAKGPDGEPFDPSR